MVYERAKLYGDTSPLSSLDQVIDMTFHVIMTEEEPISEPNQIFIELFRAIQESLDKNLTTHEHTVILTGAKLALPSIIRNVVKNKSSLPLFRRRRPSCKSYFVKLLTCK